VATPAPVVTATPTPAAPRVTAPTPAPTPIAASTTPATSSATKTIFGVPAPKAPDGFVTGQRASQPGAPVSTSEADSNRTETAKVDKKTGARKVDVPTPEMAAPAAAPPAAAAPPRAAAAPVAAPTADNESQPTTQPGYDSRGGARKRPEPAVPVTAERPRQPRRETPVWTYVGIGFAFGLILLGIYQLYGLIAH
jgi:hypothetical protein